VDRRPTNAWSVHSEHRRSHAGTYICSLMLRRWDSDRL
jgi:hypothetical protein